jgi:anti-sigma28 factor (negative regulator of flagellin synthesis)
MKKLMLLMVVTIFAVTTLTAQKAEVLYFKANLACCKARACAGLQKEVQGIIEANFTAKDLVYKTVQLEEAANKQLVEKHKARSQTLVLVVKKRRGETVVDLSDLVRKYQRDRNKADFEKELVARIKTAIG